MIGLASSWPASPRWLGRRRPGGPGPERPGRRQRPPRPPDLPPARPRERPGRRRAGRGGDRPGRPRRPDGPARPELLRPHLRPLQGGRRAGPGRPRPGDPEHRAGPRRGLARGLRRHPPGPGRPPLVRLGQGDDPGHGDGRPRVAPGLVAKTKPTGPEIAPVVPDETAAILFTSGSTGVPKGVVYTHAIFRAQVDLLRETYGIRARRGRPLHLPPLRPLRPDPGDDLRGPRDGLHPPRPGRPDEDHRSGRRLRRHEPLRLARPDPPGRGLRRPERSQAPHPPPGDLRRRPGPGEGPGDFRSHLLAPEAQIFTPYGATESLPVCSIGSDEILRETRHQTDRGAGVCVGRPVERDDGRDHRDPGRTHPDLVRRPRRPRRHHRRDRRPRARSSPGRTSGETRPPPSPRSTTRPAAAFWHRMGDVGYRDSLGRIWFCGRKSHRVITPFGTMFTIPVEGIFNTHPIGRALGPGRGRACRTGAAGALRRAKNFALLVHRKHRLRPWETIRDELLALAETNPITRGRSRRSCRHPGSRSTSATTPRSSARSWRSGRRGELR